MTKSDTPKRYRLLRVLGVGFGIAVIIGNTIGGGDLFASRLNRFTTAASGALPGSLGSWRALRSAGRVLAGQLGAMIPKSGGQYVFARHALGEYAGFLVGWSDWISTCGSTAGVSLLIGEFAGALFPVLNGQRGAVAVATTVAIFFAVLQWRGIVWGSTSQNITSLLKGLAFLVLIAAAFTLGGKGATAAVTAAPPAIPVGVALITALVLSLQSIIYTYDGWNGVIYFSEEVTNPGRDIPRSMLGGVFSIIAIYLLVNLALLYVLGISNLAGKDYAAGAAAEAIFGSHGDTIFRVLAILSMLSAINAYHLMSTRVLFAISRDGLFVKKAAEINKGGTPTVALFTSAVVSILFIVFGKTFDKVITVLAFFFVANYTLSFVSLFVLRAREPERERPYRAWGYPWTTALVLLGSVLFLAGAIASDTTNSVYALLLLAISYPLFRLLKLGRVTTAD